MENKKTIIERLSELAIKLSETLAPSEKVEVKLEDEPAKVEETIEVKLMEVKMLDGTVIKYNEDMTGAVIVLVDSEGNIIEEPLKVGEYVLEDNKVLVVIEEGIVSEIKEVEVTPEEEVEMSAEIEKLQEIATKLSAEVEALRNKKIELEAELIKLSKTPIAEAINTAPIVKSEENIKLTVAQKHAQLAKLRKN